MNRPVRSYRWVSGKAIDIFREYGADGWMNKNLSVNKIIYPHIKQLAHEKHYLRIGSKYEEELARPGSQLSSAVEYFLKSMKMIFPSSYKLSIANQQE